MDEANITPWPAPKPSAWSKAFWEGAKEGRLLIQICGACARRVFYPRLYCPSCLSPELGWMQASGRGTIYSYTIVRSNAPSAFAASVPYVVAVVRIEEGVQMLANIVGSDLDELRCDAPVEVVFEAKGDWVLPQFRLARAELCQEACQCK